MSVIMDTSAPSAVRGAPSLVFIDRFKCRACEKNNELNALAQAWMLAKTPANKIAPKTYSVKMIPSLFKHRIINQIIFIIHYNCNFLPGTAFKVCVTVQNHKQGRNSDKSKKSKFEQEDHRNTAHTTPFPTS